MNCSTTTTRFLRGTAGKPSISGEVCRHTKRAVEQTTPAESYVPAVSVACEPKTETSAKTVRAGQFKQALQGLGTIFGGLLSYAGVTKPVAKKLAAEGQERESSRCPHIIAVLEQPLGQGMEICAKEELAYETLNQSLKGNFSTLDQVFSDPDAFKKDINGRFEAQRAKTPQDPYSFDFSDYGIPVIKEIGKCVDKEIDELNLEVAGKSDRRFSKKDLAEREVGLQYLNDLKSEIGERVRTGDLSYRRTQEIGYFASCALGYFDMDDIELKDRMLLKIDSYLQSEDRVGIEEEYRRYKDNEFTVHQKPARRISGFHRVEDSYKDAFFNPDQLEMISLPTLEEVDREPFERLANKDIFLHGVASDPMPADGFVRQSRLFWLHDVRHNSSIFGKKKAYEQERSLSPEQKKKLDRRIDVWNVELNAAMDEIKDPNMVAAIETLTFNFHHDRGLPFVPSTFDKNELRPVTKSLRFMWGISGQGERFDSPRKYHKKAYAWLEDFWQERRPQEKAIVGR